MMISVRGPIEGFGRTCRSRRFLQQIELRLDPVVIRRVHIPSSPLHVETGRHTSYGSVTIRAPIPRSEADTSAIVIRARALKARCQRRLDHPKRVVWIPVSETAVQFAPRMVETPRLQASVSHLIQGRTPAFTRALTWS